MSTISVLVPIYYKENIKTINKCLTSIASQTVKPEEIVCALDEPSTPEIEEIIDTEARFFTFGKRSNTLSILVLGVFMMKDT